MFRRIAVGGAGAVAGSGCLSTHSAHARAPPPHSAQQQAPPLRNVVHKQCSDEDWVLTDFNGEQLLFRPGVNGCFFTPAEVQEACDEVQDITMSRLPVKRHGHGHVVIEELDRESSSSGNASEVRSLQREWLLPSHVAELRVVRHL